MNLLISEMPPVDLVLDRAIPWMDDLGDDRSSPAGADEGREHEGRVATSRDPAWYEPRLSKLRQLIMNAD